MCLFDLCFVSLLPVYRRKTIQVCLGEGGQSGGLWRPDMGIEHFGGSEIMKVEQIRCLGKRDHTIGNSIRNLRPVLLEYFAFCKKSKNEAPPPNEKTRLFPGYLTSA